jgi:3',5'-nucleoside bisphosphate phosphatase
MKVELHCHTSQRSWCAAHLAEEMLARLVDLEYEAVFLTDHDAVWPIEEIGRLRERFPQIAIHPGAELTVHNAEGFGHLLVLGTTDAEFLELREPGDILARARRMGCLTVLAHPNRWEGAGQMLAEGFFPDAVEFRTPNHSPLQGTMTRVTAQRQRLRLINTGDAHGKDYLGRFWIETRQPFQTPQELRQIVLDGEYDNASYETPVEES